MKTTMLMVALLGGALMAQNGPLVNGVYAVEEGSTKGKNLVIRQYEGKDVVLDTANFAPLVIEGKPQINRDARGSWLMIQLAPEAAKRLEDLTRSHMDLSRRRRQGPVRPDGSKRDQRRQGPGHAVRRRIV